MPLDLNVQMEGITDQEGMSDSILTIYGVPIKIYVGVLYNTLRIIDYKYLATMGSHVYEVLCLRWR